MSTRPATTRPRRRPQPVPRRRAQLRVIPGGKDQEAAAEPARVPGVRFAVFASIVFAAVVFGLVLMHIMLAQTSFELQKVNEKVVREEARYRQMRYEVATAESPAKIAKAAAELGLTPPLEQRYLLGPDGQTNVAAADDEQEDVKSVLSGGR